MGKLIQFPTRIQQPQVSVTATVPKVAPAPQVEALAPGIHSYYPEMSHPKPTCQIEGYSYGGRYYLRTAIALKGRGIRITPGTGPDQRNWHEYTVTRAAFDVLKAQYSIALKLLLD